MVPREPGGCGGESVSGSAGSSLISHLIFAAFIPADPRPLFLRALFPGAGPLLVVPSRLGYSLVPLRSAPRSRPCARRLHSFRRLAGPSAGFPELQLRKSGGRARVSLRRRGARKPDSPARRYVSTVFLRPFYRPRERFQLGGARGALENGRSPIDTRQPARREGFTKYGSAFPPRARRGPAAG